MTAATSAAAAPAPSQSSFALSRGEVAHLLAFAQGAIMVPELRAALRRSWGLCARHAAGWLVVESALRGRYLHGPALLYADLVGRAVAAVDAQGPLAAARVARRLAAAGACPLCDAGIGAASEGLVGEARWRSCREPGAWLSFIDETRAHWCGRVCGVCDGSGRAARCRRHLADELARHAGPVPDDARTALRSLGTRIAAYDRSFGSDHRGSDTRAGRAALVEAAGWCSGWPALLALDAQRGTR